MVINKIGVVGAGQMGAGIAQVAASNGFSVSICDVRNDSLISGRKVVEKSLMRLSNKKLIENPSEIIDRIHWHADIEKLGQCDLIIEAIIENEDAKRELFRTIDSIAKEEAIIASNTSSISITRLAHSTTRPHKFIGMHFMNPVPLMQLVEVITGHNTSRDTVALAKSVIERLGKTATLAKDYPGFIANRILMPLINEAFYVLMEGVSNARDIDATMKLGCNFPMGPLSLADLIGLDTCLAIMKVMHEGLGEDKYRPCPLLKKYVDAGLLGRKTNQGIFTY